MAASCEGLQKKETNGDKPTTKVSAGLVGSFVVSPRALRVEIPQRKTEGYSNHVTDPIVTINLINSVDFLKKIELRKIIRP